MQPLLLFAVLIALAPVSTATAQIATKETVAASGPTLHLIRGRWFDGTDFVPADWYVVEGRMTRVRPAHVDATVDLSGRWVIPPMAEAHNHDLQNAFFAAQSAPKYIARGIFYSAQFCANSDDLASFRNFLDGAATPDVIFAEACISSSDGHPLGIALASAKQGGYPLKPEDVRDKGYWAVDSMADLDTRWPKIAATKPAIVKVILIDSPRYANNRSVAELFGFNGLDPALVPEIVRRAHKIGARVAAHVDTAADFESAVDSGVDIIAHLPGYRIAKGKTAADYHITDTAIGQAAKRQVMVITTTAASKYAIKAHPGHAVAIKDAYSDNIRRLRAAGVILLTGSDAIDGSVLDEVDSLDALKVMPRAELLRIATMTTPRALFPARNIGRFAEGADGSMMVLAANPLIDLTALRRPVFLIKRGSVLAKTP